ncbi:vasorin b [Pygocentrus nattereri]|uniref:EGF-like domain-containing protein n=1 Tax=Pygocentrus nattereri TaxID=42514 RepID=A0A3B4C5R4_PYGNA|nr:vasorin b [Pygocentrus nattereri]
MKPFLVLLQLLLLFLLLPLYAWASNCPKDCTCSNQDTILCFQRRGITIPSEVPMSTKNLYVFQNGIEALYQEDFIGLENLEMLDLSQNKLTKLLGDVFKPLSSLRNLDLSSNQIIHISEDSFAGLELLERLYLYNNAIKSIHSAAFDGLEQLLELKLQGNQLTTIPALKMPHLLLLDLRFNRIPSLGPSDLQTPKLESLKLAGLGLSTLNEEFLSILKNIHELDISNNQLSAFPPALREARELVILSLAGNPMGPLKWEDIENLTELQELDISNLSLQTLPESMTQLFPHLKRLTVAENPFNCLCTLAWFPRWLHNQEIVLGRTEETRCHFPPRNAGKVLQRLGHHDFGCPTTTTITTSTVKTTTLAPSLITSLQITTHVIPPLKPSDDPSTETDINLPPPVPASPSSSTDPDLRMSFCTSNICLNGGTCWLDNQGHVECTCPRGLSGRNCENTENTPLFEDFATATVTVVPEITAQIVTSSSILLDLHRYIEVRPFIRGVKLTYRNLSGLDKRPKQLNIPASYPEYTLRGLHPNSTYSVCASPLGEPSDIDSVCTEAQTPSHQPPSAQVEDPKLTTMLVPAMAILLLLVLVAVAVGVACYMHRKKAHLHLDCNPSQLELEGVKAGLDTGALPQKQQEIMSSPSAVQNGGLDYDVPLMQDYCTANNNINTLKPSYF